MQLGVVIAMSKDIRVLILKLADRLHNIETIEFHKKWTQEKIARNFVCLCSFSSQTGIANN